MAALKEKTSLLDEKLQTLLRLRLCFVLVITRIKGAD